MKKIIWFLLWIGMIICLSACGSSREEGKNTKYSFTDDLGRVVQLEKLERVAVLNASYTEVWALAGGTDSIVGVADNTWTDTEIELPKDCISLGTHNEISLEKLIACHPDLVIASTDISQNMEQMEVYEQAGLSVAYFGVTCFDDYLKMLKICTELTGQKDCYETYGTAILAQVEQAKEKVGKVPPKVLFVRASSGGVKAKNSKGTVLGQMLKEMGCENIADSDSTLLEDLSMEVILEQDPDFIFAIYMGRDQEALEEQMRLALFSDGAWGTLSAVKKNRFFVMDNDLFSMKPNEKWGEAYEILADILYGEAK